MIPFVGLASSLGGRDSSAAKGPLVIQETFKIAAEWKEMIVNDTTSSNKLDCISLLNKKLANRTYQCVKNYPFTVIIGGDHSCAIGTWSGVATAVQETGEELALLWFDAHMDAHTMESSPSGNIHGMPIAALLGYGSEKLTHILSKNSKIKPENLFLIGIRSYEEPEKILLTQLNVKIYYMEEVKERGLRAILNEILEIISNKKLKYGLSVDIDFFDPSFMSATGTPSEEGLNPAEFIESCNLLPNYPPLAFEFVEFNPTYDRDHQSLEWVHQILKCVVDTIALPVLSSTLDSKSHST